MTGDILFHKVKKRGKYRRNSIAASAIAQQLILHLHVAASHLGTGLHDSYSTAYAAAYISFGKVVEDGQSLGRLHLRRRPRCSWLWIRLALAFRAI